MARKGAAKPKSAKQSSTVSKNVRTSRTAGQKRTAGTAFTGPKALSKDSVAARKRARLEAAEAADDSEWEDGRLTSKERTDLVLDGQRLGKQNTSVAYETQLRKWDYYNDNPEACGVEEQCSKDLTTEVGVATAVRWLKWLGAGAPGLTTKTSGRSRGKTLSLSTLQQAHAALQNLLQHQLVKTGKRVVAKLLDDPAYKLAYKNLERGLFQKGERRTDGSEDPQDNTAESTYDSEQWYKMNDHWLKQGTAAAARSQAMAALAHHTVGRSDDVRQFYLADVVKPRHYNNIGPSPCLLLPIVLKNGKTMRGGRVAYSGGIRSKDPVVCMQRALGYHVVQHWTLQGAPFPDPRNVEEWYTAALFPGRNPAQNITYDQWAESLKEVFQAVGIDISKVTHAFRVGGARALDESGVDDQVVARMGKWIYQAMYRAYLLFFKTEGLLAMGGWPDAAKGETQMYWHERFMVQVPVDLLDHVMPFIKGLRAALEELGQEAKASMRSVLAAMEYLALVVVQDALELAEEYPDHPVHQHLAEHEAFRKLLEDYKHQKATDAFEVVRPKNTREMAHHTHSLMQDLCGAVMLGRYPETWVQMLQQRPSRLMVTRQELEERARAELRPLQAAIEQMAAGSGGPSEDYEVPLTADGFEDEQPSAQQGTPARSGLPQQAADMATQVQQQDPVAPPPLPPQQQQQQQRRPWVGVEESVVPPSQRHDHAARLQESILLPASMAHQQPSGIQRMPSLSGPSIGLPPPHQQQQQQQQQHMPRPAGPASTPGAGEAWQQATLLPDNALGAGTGTGMPSVYDQPMAGMMPSYSRSRAAQSQYQRSPAYWSQLPTGGMLPSQAWPGAASLGMPWHAMAAAGPSGLAEQPLMPPGAPAHTSQQQSVLHQLVAMQQQQMVLQQQQIDLLLHMAQQQQHGPRHGPAPGFTAGMERRDRPPAAYDAGITGPAARAGVVPSAEWLGMDGHGPTAALARPAMPVMPQAHDGREPKGSGKSKGKGKGKAGMVQRAIPLFSSFISLAQLDEHYDRGLPDYGQVAWRVLEEEQGSDWRKNQKREWSEVVAFAKLVSSRLSAADKAKRGHTSRALVVQDLDRVRVAKGLSVSAFLRQWSRHELDLGDGQQQQQQQAAGNMQQQHPQEQQQQQEQQEQQEEQVAGRRQQQRAARRRQQRGGAAPHQDDEEQGGMGEQ